MSAYMHPATTICVRYLPERYRTRLAIALMLSMLTHGLILSLQFGIPGLGLPSLELPWNERRAQTPELSVRLADARSAPTPAASPETEHKPPPTGPGMLSGPLRARERPRTEIPPAVPPSAAKRMRPALPAESAGPAPVLKTPGRKTAPPPLAQPDPFQPESQQQIIAQRESRQEAFAVPPSVPDEPAQQVMPKAAPPDPPAEIAGHSVPEAAAVEEPIAQANRQAAQKSMEEDFRRAREQEARQQEEADAKRAAMESDAATQAVEAARRQAAVLALQEQAEAAQKLAAEETMQRQAQEREAMKLEETRRQQEAKAEREAIELEARKQAEEAARRQASALARRQQEEELAARDKAQEFAARRKVEAPAAQQREAESSIAASAPTAGTANHDRPAATANLPKSISGGDLASRALEQARKSDPLRAPQAARPSVNDLENPRRGSIFGSIDREIGLTMYIESWRLKIERNGRLNYSQASRDKARYDPIVTVAIRSDGSIEDILIDRSSGRPELDEAVRRIVRVNARYSVFPPELARKYDVIEIRRVWVFDDKLRILEEMR